MLAHSVPTARAPAEGAPECGNGGTCQPCTRRWQPIICQKAHARTFPVCRVCFLFIMCPPHALSVRTTSFSSQVMGVWGAFPHPNGRTEQPVRFAHAPAESIPDWQNSGACQPRTRRWQSLCQKAHALTGSAYRACFLSIMCPPHALSSRTTPFIFPSEGDGALPHPNGGTEKPASPARAVDSQFAIRHMLPPFCLFMGVWGLCPHD